MDAHAQPLAGAVASATLPAVAGRGLAGLMRDAIGENIWRCWQCVRCTAGCPLAEQFDLAPNQVMRSIQLGDEAVLASRAIWLCASCHTCATRCPRGIDVTAVMDALRIEASARGVPPAIPEIPAFNAIFLRLAKWFGRVPETLLMGWFNLARGKPFHDARLGWELLRRGRLKLLPKFVRGRTAPAGSRRPASASAATRSAQLPRPAGSRGSASAPAATRPAQLARSAGGAGAVGYFPGCASEGSAFDYDRTARAAARALDIELVEPEGWTCCGSSPAHASDAALATVMPMRAVAAIERAGIDTLTSPCSSCFARLKTAEHEVSHDAAHARLAAEATGHEYAGTVRVQHLLDTFVERAGIEAIAARVRRPLAGLSVACYYGCLITRPARITGAEHHEYPVRMDELVRALGATPVDWSGKTDCCGGALGVTQTEASLKLTRRILDNARECGAEAVVTMCPMCHMNLDVRQTRLGLGTAMPILHATQLMLIAFGAGEREVLLDRALTDSRPLLGAKGLLAAP